MDEPWKDQLISVVSDPDATIFADMKREGALYLQDCLSCKEEEDPGGYLSECSPSNSDLYSPGVSNLQKEIDEADGSPKHFFYGSPLSPGSPDRHLYSPAARILENGYSVSEISKDDDSPKRLCLVCGDVASGFHYGVASCEACKAFFKRTIQGNIEYSCPASNDCEINKRRRKACQACRFQKCLRMGMLKEGVRLDRVRGGRQKYRRSLDTQYQSQPPSIKRETLEENKILTALIHTEPEMLSSTTNHSDLTYECSLMMAWSQLMDNDLVAIIGWAKQIPGFASFGVNDQMRLLHAGWTDVFTVGLAYRSLSCPRRLRNALNWLMDAAQARQCHAEELFGQFLMVVDRFRAIEMSKEEYLLLKALVLSNCDAVLDEPAKLAQFRETILCSLQRCVAAMRPSSVAIHVHHMILCLPCVRQLDVAIRRFWLNVNHSGKIPLNKLFVEMLDPLPR